LTVAEICYIVAQRGNAVEENTEVNEEVVEAEIVEEVVEEERKEVIERRSAAFDMAVRGVDEKKRTVSIAVSSELPVERSFGKEILVHEANAIDMAFLASGRAPLLLDHDMERQIGVIQCPVRSLRSRSGGFSGCCRWHSGERLRRIPRQQDGAVQNER